MKEKSRRITLPCDCKCCMLVIEKTVQEGGAVNYSVSVQDSRYDHNGNTVWGRLKSAGQMLFGKPVCYNDLYLDGEETFQKLIEDMQSLAASDLGDEPAR